MFDSLAFDKHAKMLEPFTNRCIHGSKNYPFICASYMLDLTLNARHCKMKSGHVMLQCHLFSTHVLSGFTEQTVVEKEKQK